MRPEPHLLKKNLLPCERPELIALVAKRWTGVYVNFQDDFNVLVAAFRVPVAEITCGLFLTEMS